MMNPEPGAAALYSAGAILAATGAFFWSPLRAVSLLLVKIVLLYFITGMGG